MSRMIIAMMVPILVIVLTALALSGPAEPMPALYTPADCTRVKVVDRRLRDIEGIEDIVLLPNQDVYFTAYNRRYAELPARGLYRTTLEALAGPQPIAVEPVPGIARAVDSLYPHGFDIDRTGQRLAFVNRPAEGTAEVVWGTLSYAGFLPAGRWSGPSTCRANDVLWRGADLLVSIDRESCESSMNDLWPGSETGSLVRVGISGATQVADGLAFANGMALNGGRVLVAETRGDRLVDPASGETVPLPGGPDNLSPGPLGTIIIAVHVDLFDYWLYTLGWSGSAPTRILSYDPRSGEITALLDDRRGEAFSGGTVGVMALNRLVVGSAYDRGLLLCGPDIAASRAQGRTGG
ncbi:MAG: hypothetical protein AAF677_07300 [Pseudomonadota bacterium]